MEVSGDEVHCLTASGVEVGGIGLTVGIYRHQYPFVFALALEHRLTVGEHQLTKVSKTQSFALPVGVGHGCDLVRQASPLRRVKTGTQGVVSLGFVPRRAPLAAVIDAGDAGHSKQQAIDQGQVAGILQDAGRPGDVVIVCEAQQVPSLVQCPWLRAELALETVDNFEEIHGVQAGIKPLVALIVGAGVEHRIVYPLVVVSVEGLPHQEELRFQPVAELPQAVQKLPVQTIGHVQPQSVDVEPLHPKPDGLQQMICDGAVAQVQFYQFIVAFPALVPKAVVVVGVSVKIDMKPVLIGGIPLPLLYVSKGPEASSHMVEYPVQHHLDPMAVEGLADSGEILVGSKAAVDFPVVPGVIAVAVAFKDGGEVDRIRPEAADVLRPVSDFADAAGGDAVILPGGSAEAQRIDLIEYALVCPHDHRSFSVQYFYGTTIPQILKSVEEFCRRGLPAAVL